MHSARQIQRHHRRERQRQIHAGLRHPLWRRPAPLSGKPERLRPQHRAARRPPGCGRRARHTAHRRHRAAPLARRAQIHRGHHHRGLALSAPALREAGRAALRARRRARAAANARTHRRAAAHPLPGPNHLPDGPAGGGPQRRLHRTGRMGAPARLRPLARGWRISAHQRLPAHRPLQGTHHRAARADLARDARQRSRLAQRPGARAGARQRHRSRAARRQRPACRAASGPAHGRHGASGRLFHPPRLPRVRHQLCRARPAPVFLQQQTRLVPRMRGHRLAAHARAAPGAG